MKVHMVMMRAQTSAHWRHVPHKGYRLRHSARSWASRQNAKERRFGKKNPDAPLMYYYVQTVPTEVVV